MASGSLIFQHLYDAVISARKTLTCPICFEKISNAVQLSTCGHIFCHLCISKIKYTNTEPCPVCKRSFTRRDIATAKEELAEYEMMLDRFSAQLSLDMGFDVMSYTPPKTSTGKYPSPIAKKETNQNNSVQGTNSKGIELHSKNNSFTQKKGDMKMFDLDAHPSTTSLHSNEKKYAEVKKLPNIEPGATLKNSSVKSLNTDQFSEEDLDIFVPKSRKSYRTKLDGKCNLLCEKDKHSTRKEILNVSEQNIDDHVLSSKENNPSLKQPVFVHTTELDDRARIEAMNKVVQQLEEEVNSSKPCEVLEKKVDENKTFIDNKVNNCKTNLKKNKKGESDIKDVNGCKQEVIEKKENESCVNYKIEEIKSFKENLISNEKIEISIEKEELMKTKEDKGCKNEENNNKKNIIIKKNRILIKKNSCENGKMNGKVKDSEEKNINRCEKTNKSKRNNGNSKKEDLYNIKKELTRRNENERNNKNISFYKKNVRGREIKSYQYEKEDMTRCVTDTAENKIDKNNSKNKEKNCDLKSEMPEKNDDQSDELISSKDTAIKENVTDVNIKKRKRIAMNTMLETKNEFEHSQPLLQSPVKKKHCSDIGIQTSPSRLYSLYEEMKTKFTDLTLPLQPGNIKNHSTIFNNEYMSKYKTPTSVLSLGNNHSTPFSDIKNLETIKDDVSIQLTQKNLKLQTITPSDFKVNEIQKSLDIKVGKLETPLTQKLITPAADSAHGFPYSVISNPTTSEKRRINDSKFFNDSTGFPGDSLLENSELSSSILQSNNTFTETKEKTPQVVNKRPKRISRRLLEFYDDGSNSTDMFDANNAEEILDTPKVISRLPISEPESCSDSQGLLDLNIQNVKEGTLLKTDEILFSQESESGSTSSSKENHNPKEQKQSFDPGRSDNKSTANVLTNESFLQENKFLKSSATYNMKEGGCGVFSAIDKEGFSSEPKIKGSLNVGGQQEIINTEGIIEDSDEDDNKCLIEATPDPSPEKVKTQSSQSTSINSIDVKDFCFVTSSLLPSQLRSVKILAQVLGCRINNNVTDETSHLIIQTCENGRINRTLKYLQAIVMHKVVVSYKWVTDSLEEKAVLPVETYIVYDTWGAPAVHRSLNNCGNFLLKNFAVAIAEPTLELTASQVEELVDACGAIIIKDPRCFNFVPSNLLRVILTDKENIREEAIGWLKKYKAVAVRIDWLVSSIAQYEVSSLNNYLHVPLEKEVLLRLGFPNELTVEENEDVPS